MRVVIAGGHGQIALRLERLLTARGDSAVALIRNPDQAEEVRAAGGEPVVTDLERVTARHLAQHLAGADAVVFAAGAGPGSGVARKDTVDRAAAALLADAAEQAGVRRYVQVSSIGASEDPATEVGEVFAAYLKAKSAAESDLRARDLDWTIVRPGHLTDGPGTGRVKLAEHVENGDVPRDDVANVLVAVLDQPASTGHTVELVAGDTPIDEAVAAI